MRTDDSTVLGGIVTRRGLLATGAAAGSAAFMPSARAADGKLTFLTSWFAQAEHGGFYQAHELGLYKKAGLDVTIRMGGPQVNGLQLLTGGDADAMIGYDAQILKSVENHLPVTTLAASFQFDLQGIMTHTDVKSLADLKGKKILIASSSHSTFWPWMKKRFGYTDDQAGPYTFNLQPFLVDNDTECQGYPSSEPFQAENMGAKVNYFLLADYGYPPYGTTIVTTTPMAEKNPEVMQAFVKASMEGWRSYLTEDPTPGNKLIKNQNPKMTDVQMAYAIKWMRENHACDRGDAAKLGVGTMTDARWKATRDFMVQAGLLGADVDYKKAYTLKFVENLKVMMT
jgi:NitT/TauT family transport system substrate-binding protein